MGFHRRSASRPVAVISASHQQVRRQLHAKAIGSSYPFHRWREQLAQALAAGRRPNEQTPPLLY